MADLALYARRFFSGTLLSRISGMGRDLMMAFAFGDHPAVAAFMVAFRLSNLLRRLLGEGPLQSAFIPHFEGLRVQDGTKASFFFCKLAVFMAVLLLGITLFAEIGLVSIASWSALPESTREIITLTAWLFPGIIFICLYGLNISILNCHDSFFIPSVAPFICNGIWIAAAFFLRDHPPVQAMSTLAKWVVIGFMGQWLLTLPLTLKHISIPWREWLRFTIPPEVKKLAQAFSLGAIGVGAVQINAFADALFARYADIRGPAYLWYSIRLEQLALALFGIVCISTIVPRLSRAIKSDRLDDAKELFLLSYKRIMTIMIPCTFAIAFLGLSAINLMYGRGHFSELAVLKTSICLAAYGLSLVPTVLIMLFSAVYYAQGNFKTAMQISLFAVATNIMLNSLFVFGLEWGAVSVALATSFSAWINSFILSRLMNRMGWTTGFSLANTVQIVLISTFASLSTLTVDYFFYDSSIIRSFTEGVQTFPKGFAEQLICFFVHLIAFVGGFFSCAFALKNAPILELFQVIFSRKRVST